MAKTQTERAVIDLVINGQQAKTSLKEVSLEVTRTYSALQKMKEVDNPELYRAKLAEYHKLIAAQREMRGQINNTTTAWGRFKKEASTIASGVLGGNLITSGIEKLISIIPAAVARYREFNAASQELSAVTGATGADLAYLNRMASQLGPSMGKSGAEMLEAFKLMGSAKPELLSQKELLVDTTKAAITLAQAGKIDLAEATKVTAESLNQFGQGADQANRFINVIAAGAKEGSAEINDMGIALKNSGTIAAAQGVSFEQTNALLQSMSSIALKGGEAGTQLRNVLLTLGSGSDDTNPKVVGLQVALDNLAKQNLSTAEMTKLFGKENITAAQHIVTHRDGITELTDKLTGTQEAFTQAAKNNASFDHQLEVFWARVEGLAVLLGTHLVPALTKVIEGATSLTQFLTGGLTPASEAATQAFEEQRDVILSLERNISPLLTRHDELKKKTVLTKDEQAELKNIISQVAQVIPGAATEFDKYGNALDINTGKAREFIEVQKELLKYTNKVAIEENESSLKTLEQRNKAALAAINNGKKTINIGGQSGAYGSSNNVEVDLSKAEMDALRKELAETSAEIEQKKRLLKGLTGDYLNLPATTPPKTGSATSTPPAGGGGGQTDEEKKKLDEKKRANKEAILAIEKLKAEAVKNEKERELAQALFAANQEKERMRTSKANADLKATWLKAIENKLTTDKQAIIEKYSEKERELEEKRLKEVLEFAEAELALKKKVAQFDIDVEVQKGKKTKEEGEREKLALEEQYLDAKEILNRAYFKTLEDLNQGSAERLQKIERDKLVSLLEIKVDKSKVLTQGEDLNQGGIDKAYNEDLSDLETKRQLAQNEIAKKRKKNLITEKEEQVATVATEKQYLDSKRQLQEAHYDALAKLSTNSADQLKSIERDKNKALLQTDTELMNAQQQQYEGKLGAVLKFLDTKQQYLDDAATLMKGLFAVDQQKLDVGPLLNELDKLQSKTSLTSSEQERMKSIIAQVGKVMPDAVSGTDAYGNAISINTGKARQEVEAQKKRANVLHKVMLAEKAWALASVGINFGQALMAAVKSAIGIPFPANLLAVASAMAIPTLQAGVATTKILAADVSAPAFADGGFTGMGDGPAGFVDGPTMFSMGKRRYIAGEAGREFVISNRALQNPIVADFARMMDVAQKTNNYGMMTAVSTGKSGSSSGERSLSVAMPQESGIGKEIGLAILDQLKANNTQMTEFANRPVELNYRVFEEYRDRIDFIRASTTL